jgi:hypothetical protein
MIAVAEHERLRANVDPERRAAASTRCAESIPGITDNTRRRLIRVWRTKASASRPTLIDYWCPSGLAAELDLNGAIIRG